MFKHIKKIKGLGIYKDFKWDGSISPLSKKSLIFGFNGTGKTTISRIFAALASGDDSVFDKGYEVELTTWDDRTLKIEKDKSNEDILVYNEDYVERNFSWQDATKIGAKAFVVIGQKSKEQEEKLAINTALQEQYKKEMDILDSELKIKNKDIDAKSSVHAKLMSEKLTKYNQAKYKKYEKRDIEKDIKRLEGINSDTTEKINETSELEKLNQQKLSQISTSLQIETNSLSAIVKKIKEYIESSKPDKVEMLLTSLELEWVKKGVPLHEHKERCIYCGEALSQEKKSEINKIISNAVAEFVQNGTDLILEIEKFKLPNQLPISSSQLYSDLSLELALLTESYGEILNNIESWMAEAKGKIESHKNYINFDPVFKASADSLCGEIKNINAKLKELVDKHNTRTIDFESVRNEALANIELMYLAKYKAEIMQLSEDKIAKDMLFITTKTNFENSKKTVDEIQKSLASEGKAALEINEMLGKFLGRKDIKIEFSEADSKFILKRNDTIAKKLSEGEKTAISVCYFLISVRANPEAISEKIVVIDDPVTSLDSTNIYNAFAILRNYLKDVKQLIVLTHSLVFFRLVYRWFSKSGDESKVNSFLSVVNTISGSDRVAAIKTLPKNDREANTEYVLIYRSLKHFIESSKNSTDLSNMEALPYPNMLRKLIEIYATARRPGWNGENHYKLLKDFGMTDDVAFKAGRFCNDFSHGNAYSLVGPDMESFSSSDIIIEEIVAELERIDPDHFSSIKNGATT